IEEVAVDQTVATREEAVVSAEVDVLTRSLALRRAAGMPIGPGELELAPVAPLTAEPAALDFDALYARALAANPQLAVLEARIAGIDIDLRVAEDAMRARLDASISAGLDGVGPSPTKAGKDLVELNGWSVSARLDYQQNLGNRAARGGRDRARAERSRMDVQIADAKQSTAEALARAVAQARSSARRIELTAKIVKLAEQSIEAEKARERLGRSTSFDVAQREEELAQAQLGHTRATMDYLVAAASVDALTGDLLGRWGITIEDR
ncbi:MAG TPA: TolC family protein, partial [Kofleriaceae bacterium]|nr:TolC family protein [Kofleriaceae bacterium]